MRNNTAQNRFEIDIEGKIVFATYRIEGKNISILHMETPPDLRGQGAAGKLMQEIVGYAQNENLKIIPICPYAVAWLERNSHKS